MQTKGESMSKALELAYEKAQNTKFIFRDDRTIEVENAAIVWPDFTGRVTEYHKVLGEKRSFNLVLNGDMLNALKDLESKTGAHFRIRQAVLHKGDDPKDTKGDIGVFYINVKVNLESEYPPIVTLFTEYRKKRSRKTLDKATIGLLDSADLKCVDLILNCYIGRLHPEQITAYLKKLNAIQEPDVEFGGKYDDWEDINKQPDEVINPATGDPENN